MKQSVIVDGGGERSSSLVSNRGKRRRKWKGKAAGGLLVAGRATSWRKEEE